MRCFFARTAFDTSKKGPGRAGRERERERARKNQELTVAGTGEEDRSVQCTAAQYRARGRAGEAGEVVPLLREDRLHRLSLPRQFSCGPLVLDPCTAC